MNMHRKTVALATAAGTVLALGLVACENPAGHPWPISCTTASGVRHTATTHSTYTVRTSTMLLKVRGDASVSQMITVVGPADGPHTAARVSGRAVDIAFRTNTVSYAVWVALTGPGGSCIGSILTRVDRGGIH